MITGFNTNVRHGGRVFHVQTEDSGRDHPHVISHLYYGGTILASEKREYAEHVDAPDLTNKVRQLMDEQHRSMLERLAGGDFDAMIAERLGGGENTGDTTASREDSTGRPASPESSGPAPSAETTGPAAGADTTGPASSAPSGSARRAATPPAAAREFGEGIVSEKPLDEVILDYLVDKSRTRGPR